MGNDRRLSEIEALYRERFRHFKRVALAIVGDQERALEAVHDGFRRRDPEPSLVSRHRPARSLGVAIGRQRRAESTSRAERSGVA
jgi:hypothetical protein